MKTAIPTRAKAFQMLEPLEPNYRRPGLREIEELQGTNSGLPAGGDIDRSIADRRDRLLETLERTAILGSTQTVLEKLWGDAMTATGPRSNYVARTAGAFLAIVIRADIERERDKYFTAMQDPQRRDAKVRFKLEALTDELADQSRNALGPTEDRPTWIQSPDSFVRYIRDRFAGLESS